MKLNKRVVFAYEVTSQDQVIQIREKLPTCVNLLIRAGYTASGLFGDDQEDNPNMGVLALEFNHRKVHPVHSMVGFRKNLQKTPFKEVRFDQAMIADNVMTGYYRDTSTIDEKRVFTPYTVHVYLTFKRS